METSSYAKYFLRGMFFSGKPLETYVGGCGSTTQGTWDDLVEAGLLTRTLACDEPEEHVFQHPEKFGARGSQRVTYRLTPAGEVAAAEALEQFKLEFPKEYAAALGES